MTENDGAPGTEGYFSFQGAGPVAEQVEEFDMRAHWPAGPWDDEPDEWQGPTDVLTGVSTYACRHPAQGHWCGYVVLPRRHPLWGRDASDLGLMTHWGLSYGDVPYWDSGLADRWALGFDCGHAWDISPGMMAMYRMYESGSGNTLLARAEQGLDPLAMADERDPFWPYDPLPRYRSLRYVQDQLRFLDWQVSQRVEIPGGRRKTVRLHRIPGVSLRMLRKIEMHEYPRMYRKRVPRGPEPMRVRFVHR